MKLRLAGWLLLTVQDLCTTIQRFRAIGQV